MSANKGWFWKHIARTHTYESVKSRILFTKRVASSDTQGNNICVCWIE